MSLCRAHDESQSPYSDTICAALSWLSLDHPPSPVFPQQCYAIVTALARDGTLHGPPLEALTVALRTRVRDTTGVLTALDHVRDVVTQVQFRFIICTVATLTQSNFYSHEISSNETVSCCLSR